MNTKQSSFLKEVQKITRENRVDLNLKLRQSLKSEIRERILAAARTGASQVNFTGTYDRFIMPEDYRKDYAKVIEYFRKEGFQIEGSDYCLKNDGFSITISWKEGKCLD